MGIPAGGVDSLPKQTVCFITISRQIYKAPQQNPEFGIKSFNSASFIEIVSTLLHLKVKFVRKQKWK